MNKQETDKIKDLMHRLAMSHSELSQAEYNRNPSINDSSRIFKIEREVIDRWPELFGEEFKP